MDLFAKLLPGKAKPAMSLYFHGTNVYYGFSLEGILTSNSTGSGTLWEDSHLLSKTSITTLASKGEIYGKYLQFLESNSSDQAESVGNVVRKEFSKLIQAIILKALERATRYEWLREKPDSLVIVLPPTMDPVYRPMLQEVASSLGFGNFRIISEYTALYQSWEVTSQSQVKVVVLEITTKHSRAAVLHADHGRLHLLSCPSTTECNDELLDKAVGEFYWKRWLQTLPLPESSRNDNEGEIALQVLTDHCTAARLAGNLDRADISIDKLFKGHNFEVTFDWRKIGAAIREYVLVMEHLVLDALESSGMSGSDVERISFVGKSTHLACIRSAIRELVSPYKEDSFSGLEHIALNALQIPSRRITEDASLQKYHLRYSPYPSEHFQSSETPSGSLENVPNAPAASPKPSAIHPFRQHSSISDGQELQLEDLAMGIDFGTTYCCAALYRQGKVEVLYISDNTETMPSVVCFQENEPIVGETARSKGRMHPETCVYDVKRMLGKMFVDPMIQKFRNLWPFQVLQAQDGTVAIKVQEDQIISPEDVSMIIMSHLKKVAEEFAGEKISVAVLAVPAPFSSSQVELLRRSCHQAGFERLKLVQEPLAAAIAYIDSNVRSTPRKGYTLAFDLGGGTFDFTVFRPHRGDLEILATGGDPQLGGADFDEEMFFHCLKEFKTEHGIDLLHPGRTYKNLSLRFARLKQECEQQKMYLSQSRVKEVRVSVDAMYNTGNAQLDLICKFTKPLFNQLIDKYLTRCMSLVVDGINNAGIGSKDIVEIVLVGGSSRIPRVREMLESEFLEAKILHGTNPDHAVAIGAALFAQNLYVSMDFL